MLSVQYAVQSRMALFGPVQSRTVPYSPVKSHMVPCDLHGPVWPRLALYSLEWSPMVSYGPL